MMAHFSAIKRNQIQTHTTELINLENTMPSKGSQTERITYCLIHLYKISRVGKSVETKHKLVVARDSEERECEAIAS